MRLCDNWCRAVLAAMGDDTGDPDAAIIKAAQAVMKQNPQATSGARSNYGKVLGHDRDD